MSRALRIMSESLRTQAVRAHVLLLASSLLASAVVPCWATEPPRLVDNALTVGDEMYSTQNYEQALEEYRKVLATDPTHWHANYKVAMSYLALYHPGSTHAKDLEYADNAAEAFERLMSLQAPDPETAEKVRNYYVALLLSADKADKVIAYYTDLLAKEPENPAYLSQLAEIYARNGDVPNALKYYQLRADGEPGNKEAWYTVGVVTWEQLNKMGAAMSDEERALAIDRGRAALDKALAIDPDYFDALVYMGLIYRQKSSALSAQMKNGEAGEAFNKAEEYRHRAEEIGKKRMAERKQLSDVPQHN